MTLQELHSRLSSHLHNVQNKKCIVTNHDYKLLVTNDGVSSEIALKVGSLIDLFEFHRHIAVFFTKIEKTELYLLVDLLKSYIDKDEYKNLRIEGTNLLEDNRIIKNEDIIFTGKIFLETHNLLIKKEEAYKILETLNICYKGKKISFSIRDTVDWEKMDKSTWPSVFLCHDSKDKTQVEQLYWELKRKSINVWYDKYSLTLGDSLTEKISDGLTYSNHGIIFISKSFLSNEKWVKFELQTLISKQIYSNKKTIIPIWLDIEEEDLKDYHWLREKLAVKFSEGVESAVKKIMEAIK